MSHRGVTLLLAALLVAGSATAGGVRVDWDDSVDWSQFRTFAWSEGTPAANADTEAKIRSAVRAQLEGKGLTLAEEEPDLLVATHAASETRTLVDSSQFGYGWGNYRRWDSQAKRETKLDVGTLAVDLTDASTMDLIWRGTAAEAITDNLRKLHKKIDKVARKMFRDFPPSGPPRR